MIFRAVKERLGPLWWYAALMFAASRMGDVVNVVIGLWLVPLFVSTEKLGALLPIMNFSAVYTLPLAVLLLPVPKFLNVFASGGEGGKAKALLRDALLVTMIYGLVMAAFVFWTGDGVLLRLKLDDRRLLWLVAGFAMLTVLTPLLGSAQQAFKAFRSMVAGNSVLPYVRLTGMLIFLPLLGGTGWLLAQFGMGVAGLAIAGGAAWWVLRRAGRCESYREHWGEMLRFALPLALGMAAGKIQFPIESLVVRQRLPEEVSAGFFFVTMFGMIPMYFTGAVTPFLWVLVSDRFERGERTEGLMWQSLAFNFAVGGVVTLLAVAAWLAPRFLGWWENWPWKPFDAYAGYVGMLCLMNVIRGGTAIFTAHETACRRFGFMWYTIPSSLACSALLYVIPGWGFFQPWLPRGFYEWVDARMVVSLDVFLGVMLGSSVAVLLGVAWQLWNRRMSNRDFSTGI